MKTLLRSVGTNSFLGDTIRDLLIVIVGILAALWIDAWWQDRQDRQEERQALLGLRQEFEFNQAELEKVLSSVGETQIAAERLLTLAGKKLSDEEAEGVHADWTTVYTFWSFSPASGNLTALLNSGKLDLVSNTQLRAQLAGWLGQVADLKEEEDTLYELITFDLSRRLRQVGPYPTLQEAAPGKFQYDPNVPLADVETLNILSQIIVTSDILLSEASIVKNLLNKILGLIEGELQRYASVSKTIEMRRASWIPHASRDAPVSLDV